MTNKMTLIAAAVATMIGSAALAHGAPKGDGPCSADITSWAERDAVIAKAEELGLTAERVQMRGSCFVVMGTDADGERAGLLLQADTLEHLEAPERGAGEQRQERRGEHRGERGQRDGQRGGAQGPQFNMIQPAPASE